MLKLTITAADFNKLAKDIQSEYAKDKDGDAYTLSVEGYEDAATVKKAKQHEVDAHKETRTTLKKLQTDHDALIEERDNILRGAIPKADVEKLEKSYKEKHEKEVKAISTERDTAHTQIQKLLVDNVAQSLATEISVSPNIILPHIKSRLKTELVNGEYVTKVVGTDGSPSALTISDLRKEFVDNKDFSTIIKASNASGGGANGGSGSGGANTGGKVDFTKSPKEIARQLEDQGKVRAVGT